LKTTLMSPTLGCQAHSSIKIFRRSDFLGAPLVSGRAKRYNRMGV
jgi:hypothetical protein